MAMTLDTTMQKEIAPYIGAGYSILAIESVEEQRLARMLCTSTYTAEDKYGEPTEYDHQVIMVSASPVLKSVKMIQAEGKTHVIYPVLEGGGSGYPAAFAMAVKMKRTLCITHDWQHVMKNPAAYRALKDKIPELKEAGSVVILVAPSWSQLPSELKADVKVVKLPLATRGDLNEALNVALDGGGLTVDEDMRNQMLDAASGLVLQQAEDAFCLSYIKTGTNDPSVVADVKMDMIRQSGLLHIEYPVPLEDVGGLSEAKSYLIDEAYPSRGTEDAVRAIFAGGPPGTGKSTLAKVIASVFKAPLARCEFSRMKGSLVGQTAERMEQMLAIVNAQEHLVLWIDEFGNALSGSGSSHKTGDTTDDQIGILSTWMEEYQKPGIILICTSNEFDVIPDKILSRFDELFYVDLPTFGERIEVASVWLRKRNVPDPGGVMATELAKVSEGWSGREIRKCVLGACRRSRKTSDGKVTLDILLKAASYIKPLSIQKADSFAKMRAYGLSNMRVANTPEPAGDDETPEVTAPRRKLTKMNKD